MTKLKWINIEERLPEPWAHVDCWLAGNVNARKTDVTFDGLEFVLTIGSHLVTHWMPIPEPPKCKWISVKDRLPDSIGDYLCFSEHTITWVFFNSDKQWCTENEYICETVTHWMPIPEPPPI